MKKILKKIFPMPDAIVLLLSFGPLAMIFYSAHTTASSDGRMFFQYVISMTGALGLTAGLVWMFKILMRQQQELLRLGQLLASDNHGHE